MTSDSVVPGSTVLRRTTECRDFFSLRAAPISRDEIEFSAALTGRAYLYERNIGLADCCHWVGRGVQATGSAALRNQVIQPGFDDGAAARLQRLNLGGVEVNPGYAMPHMGETRGAYRSNIAQPENADR